MIGMKTYLLTLILFIFASNLLALDTPVGELNWGIVNDTVMGGCSKSTVSRLENGVRFSGILSLENNGGFASMRSMSELEIPDTATEVVLTVVGDGRTYFFDLRDHQRRSAFSYRNSFETIAGEKVTVIMPLGDFMATTFGRRIAGAPGITASRIRSVGISLSDKKSGPFRLDIVGIRFEKREVQDTASGQELIEQAIVYGVPMYNHGNPGACAMIYEVALRSFLIKDHPEVTSVHQKSIRKALASLPPELDARAWALRRELDQLSVELYEMRL